MKKKTLTFLLFILCTIALSLNAQDKNSVDSLGLPGDNFNLYSVLDVFQKSETLEAFEKSLNSEETKINNLDLNEDDKTDYIKVIDNVKGTAHAIVLQIAISEKENQDVAVIEVDKDSAGKIMIQIIGDEELYGKNYIIEPNEEVSKGTPNPGYTGGNTTVNNTTINNTTINNTTTNNNTTNNNTTNNTENAAIEPAPPLVTWLIFPFLFAPAYVAYHSPYYYGYYPPYYHPWPPVGFHVYVGYHPPYHAHYHTTVVVRSTNVHSSYHRTSSATVSNNNRNGNYNKSYNRPSNQPANKPANKPSNKQGNKPSNQPANKPSNKPANQPSNKPSTQPSRQPSNNSYNKPSTGQQPSRNNTRPASRPSGGGSRGGGGRR